MDDELLQSKADNARLQSRIRMLEGIIEEMEERESNAVPTGPSQIEVRLKKDIEQSRSTINSLTNENDNLQQTVKSLEGKISKLTAEVQDLEQQRPSSALDSVDTSHFERKIVSLQDQLRTCEDEKLELATEFSRAQETLKVLDADRKELCNDYEMILAESKELKRVNEELKNELRDIQAQLSESHLGGHASRGNSMFAEFVDERRKLEVDLKTLHRKYVTATNENVVLKQELDDANLRNKMFENTEANNTRCRCSHYHVELGRERTRIQELETRLSQMVSSSMGEPTNVPKGKVSNTEIMFLRKELERLQGESKTFRNERNEAVDQLSVSQVKAERLATTERILRGKIWALEAQIVNYRDKLAQTIRGEKPEEAPTTQMFEAPTTISNKSQSQTTIVSVELTPSKSSAAGSLAGQFKTPAGALLNTPAAARTLAPIANFVAETPGQGIVKAAPLFATSTTKKNREDEIKDREEASELLKLRAAEYRERLKQKSASKLHNGSMLSLDGSVDAGPMRRIQPQPSQVSFNTIKINFKKEVAKKRNADSNPAEPSLDEAPPLKKNHLEGKENSDAPSVEQSSE